MDQELNGTPTQQNRPNKGIRRKAADLAAAIDSGQVTTPAARRARCALQSMSDRNYDRAPEKHKQACEEAAREHERSLPVLRAHERGC